MFQRHLRTAPVVAAAAAFLAGCASAPPDAGFSAVSQFVEARRGQTVGWQRGGPEDAAIAAAVATALEAPLTLESAVHVALLHNPGLQAEYETLGLAAADLVQAGLPLNPAFAINPKFGLGPASGTDLTIDLAQNFLNLLLLPARVRMAEAAFARTKLTVSAAVFDLAAATERAYFDLQMHQHQLAIRRDEALAADAAYDLAQSLRAAGNLPELEVTLRALDHGQTALALRQAELAAGAAREALAVLLGLPGTLDRWTIADAWPLMPETDIPLAAAETQALGERLELQAARLDIDERMIRLGLTRTWRWFGETASVGIEAERSLGGEWTLGPSLSLALPLFDSGKTKVKRGESELRRAARAYDMSLIAVRAEVRTAHARLIAARVDVESYRRDLLPLSERVIALTEREYNFMLTGAFALLAAKRNERQLSAAHIEALRNYWVARSDLQRAIGGRLPPPSGHEAPPPAPEPDATTPHSHHAPIPIMKDIEPCGPDAVF